jgi:hypothetical protein
LNVTSKTKTTVTLIIAAIMIIGVSMFVPSLLSQLEYGKYNNCSTESASCVSGGSGEKGGGGRGHSTYDYSSSDASYSGGTGHVGGAVSRESFHW